MSTQILSVTSRRDFLRQAGYTLSMASLPAITSAARPYYSPESEQAQTAEKKAGWAIVGLGKYATEQIIPSFADCKRSRLVALVSGTPSTARRIADEHGLNAKNIYNYQNYDSLKDNPEVDVIYIILPNAMHAEYTIRGAAAGKHIISEKPMATSVEDCQKMIDACKKAGKKLMIAYRAQYEPFNLKAVEMAQGKQLGQIKMITADHGRILNPAEKHDKWRAQKSLAGGGSLMDIGIYSLQATRYITGEEPIEISAMMHSTPGDPRFKEVEENISFMLRYPSGVLASCTSSYGYADTKRFRIFGSESWLDLDPATDYYEHNLAVGSKEKEEKKKIKEGNQFALQMDHFSECVLDNKAPKTPGEEGMQDVKLMMKIYEAAREGRTLKV